MSIYNINMSSSCLEIDIVKAEKADTMRRYKRTQNFKLCLRIVAALTLLFCSFTYTSAFEHVSSAYLSLFNHQLPVFLVVNLLVLIIYHLSTTTNTVSAVSAAATATVSQSDLYDQYVSFSSSSNRKISANEEKQLVVVSSVSSASSAPEYQSSDENAVSDRQLISCENADYNIPMEEKENNPVRDLTVTTSKTSVEEKTFRRTRSEKYSAVENKRIRSDRQVLQRSETGNGRREMVVAGGYSPARKPVQEMNSEEFRLTIESFIASRKKISRDENLAVIMEEKEESFTAN